MHPRLGYVLIGIVRFKLNYPPRLTVYFIFEKQMSQSVIASANPIKSNDDVHWFTATDLSTSTIEQLLVRVSS